MTVEPKIGPDSRPEPRHGTARRGKPTLERPTQYFIYAVVALAVLLPLSFVVYGALRDSAPGLPGTFSLSSFAIIFEGDVLAAMGNTAIVGTGVTIFSVVVGALLATATEKFRMPASRGLFGMILIPSFITPFVGAVGWVVLLSPDIGYLNKALGAIGVGPVDVYSRGGLVFVMSLYYIPIVYLFCRSALRNVDGMLEESARVHGATLRSSLGTIVWPLILPAALSSAVVVFITSIGQFGAPAVLGGGQFEVLPTMIVRQMSQFPADYNLAAALGLEMVLFAVIGLWIQRRIIARRDYTTVSGKGARLTRIDPGRWGWLLSGACWFYVICAVILPLGAIVVSSFLPYLTTQLGDVGFTLSGYREVLVDSAVGTRAIRNSVLLGVLAATVATVLGGIVSYIVVRGRRVRGRGLLDIVSTLPLSVPHIVFGIGLVWVWISIPVGVYGTFWILLIAYVTLFMPYAVRDLNTGIRQIDPSLEEASRVYGGKWFTALRTVMAPLVTPSLVSGWILVFVHAVRELPASILLYSPGNEVVATQIYSQWQEGYYDQLFALATLLVVVTLALVGVISLISRRIDVR